MRHYFYHTFYWTQAPYHTTESVCGYGQEHRLSILCRDAAARPRSVQTLHHSHQHQQPAAVFGNLTSMIHSLHYIMMRLQRGEITFDIWWTLSESLANHRLCCSDDWPACAWWPVQCSGANGLQWPLTSVTPTQAGARCAAFLSQLFPYFLSGLHNFKGGFINA